MLESINEDNRGLCKANGMPEDKIEESIAQSKDGLVFILGNVVDKMIGRDLLA